MKVELRRLTPRECERLMGFPDGHLDPLESDALKYQAAGNSMATPCMRRVIMGIHKADEWAKANGLH